MIAVVLATRNGEATLPATLDSLCGQRHPGRPWKLIAVDNGSTDRTPGILAGYAARLPLAALREPRPGQNAARNRALDHLAGGPEELVVFTDDDVVADSNWLAELAAAAMRHRGCDLFGGRIEAQWPQEPPPWLVAGVPVSTAYASTDPGLAEGEIAAWQIYSPNMAVRAELFRAGHRFDAAIGPDGTETYAMGSETDFLIRMAMLGHRAVHCPSARVHHLVRPHQLTPRWLRARARRFGRGQYRLRRIGRESPPSLAEGVSAVHRIAARGACRALALGGDRAGRLARDWELHAAIGELSEWRALRRR